MHPVRIVPRWRASMGQTTMSMNERDEILAKIKLYREMMNEINALIWPSPEGVGVIDPVFWSQTVKIAKQAAIIKNDPSIDAYTTDIVKAAYEGLGGDTTGSSFQKATVEVTPGGN